MAAPGPGRGRTGRVKGAFASFVGFFDSLGKVVGAIAALLALLAAVGLVTLGGHEKPARSTKLTVPELIVENPRVAFEETRRGPAQTAASLPSVEMTLHNVGRSRSIVTRARFRVLSSAHVKVCATAGDLPVVRSYGIALPATPREGAVASSEPLRRQLGADEAEVLRFRFSLDDPDATGQVVYRLAVELTHDNASKPVRAGTVVVSVPALPDREQLWDKVKASRREDLVRDWTEPVVRCWESNSEALRRVLAEKGERDSRLDAVVDALE